VLRERDDLEVGRDLRPRLVADRPDLLDVATDLAEPEALGEPERVRILDERPRLVEAERLDVRGELTQQRRADASPAGVRKDARGQRALAREVGAVCDARSGELAVELREQQQPLGRRTSPDLLERLRALARHDSHPHPPPPLEVGVALRAADRDRARHAFSHTETCFVLADVNGSRFQPLHRSRRRMPAMRAIRSSSAGETDRNGIDSRSHRP
jgi:hypothetical protein